MSDCQLCDDGIPTVESDYPGVYVHTGQPSEYGITWYICMNKNPMFTTNPPIEQQGGA